MSSYNLASTESEKTSTNISTPLSGSISTRCYKIPEQIIKALQLLDDPVVIAITTQLQQSLINFMINYPGQLEGIDWQQEGGLFITEDIRQLLSTEAPDGSSPIMLNRFGFINIIANNRRIQVGDISIENNSPIWDQQFVSKSSREGSEQSAFRLERFSSYTSFYAIQQGSQNGFILSEDQSLAAEIVITLDYLVTYAGIAKIIANDEGALGEELQSMKVGANLDDCLDAANYCEKLKERIDKIRVREQRAMQWGNLKHFSALLGDMK